MIAMKLTIMQLREISQKLKKSKAAATRNDLRKEAKHCRIGVHSDGEAPW
jgi:hypothetical protein